MKVNSIRLEPTENGCHIHIDCMDENEQYQNLKYNGDKECFDRIVEYIEGLEPEVEAPKVEMAIPNRRPYKRMR